MSEESRSDDGGSSGNDRPSLSDVGNNETFKGNNQKSGDSSSTESNE